MSARLAAAVGLILIAVTGCAGAPPPPPEPPVAPAPAPTAAAPPVAPVAARVAAPDSAAGRQLAWVVTALAAPPTDADVAAHFTPGFIEHIPASKVIAIFGQVLPGAPFTLESVSPGSPDELSAVVHAAKGPAVSVKLAVDPSTGKMAMLLLRPKP